MPPKEKAPAGEHGAIEKLQPHTDTIPEIKQKNTAKDLKPEKLEHALKLAARGFFIFPCAPNSKTPTVAWTYVSTRDEDKIRNWWTGRDGDWPQDFNIAIDCGKSDLFVLDIDCKKGRKGLQSFRELDMQYGVTDTFMVRTPSGGFHYYYRGGKYRNSAGKLGEGVDTRSAGGYVIAPGSTIEGGDYPGVYTIEKDIAIEPIDGWLDGLLKPRHGELTADKGKVFSEDHPDDIDRAADFASTYEPAVEGSGGDHHTFVFFCRLKELGVSKEKALELADLYWNPRCSPPWEYSDLATKANNAWRFAQNATGSLSGHAEFDIPPLPINPVGRFNIVSADDFANGPEPQWIIEDVLPDQEIVMIYGEPTAGKTFFIIDMIACIALGKPWRGYAVKKGRVIYIAAEAAGGVRKRVRAYKHQHNVSFGNDFGVINDPPDLTRPDDVALAESINRTGGASVIVVDTLAQVTPGANENTGEDMSKVLTRCRALYKATGALIILVHHCGKDASKGARGWSGWKGAIDTEIEVIREVNDRFARITKQKDGEDGEIFAFTLLPVSLGLSVNDKEISSCIVEHIEGSPKLKGPKPRGACQIAVYNAVQTLSAKGNTHHAIESIIDEAIKNMLYDPGQNPAEPKRDRRRDKAKTALSDLCKELLILKDNTVCLPQYHETPQIGFCGNAAQPSTPPLMPHDSIGVWQSGEGARPDVTTRSWSVDDLM